MNKQMIPKLKYRFTVTFTGFCKDTVDDQTLNNQVYSVRLPVVTFDDSIGEQDQLIITVIDDQTNIVDSAISYRISKQLYNNDSFSCTIDLTDHNSKSLKRIVFSKCKLTKIEYSDLNYTNNESCKFKLYIEVIK